VVFIRLAPPGICATSGGGPDTLVNVKRDNELVPGEPRLGWVYLNGGSDARKVAAMLRDTGSSIELTLPTKHSYAPPRVLIFQDSFGEVALVGCRATSYQSNFAAGHGLVVSNFAVLGGRHFAYEEINGIVQRRPL
jgi:hypothetical protein